MIRTDERYTTAITSSNLKMDTRDGAPVGDADVCAASAWAKSELGSALLRLATEYGRPIRLQGMSPSDAILLMGRLKTLPKVQRELALEIKKWGHERPDEAALSIIAWWLHRVCGKCEGRGYDVIPGTARLSAKACKACHGSGESRVPQGDAGRRLANHMDDCLSRARQSIKNRLRNTRA